MKWVEANGAVLRCELAGSVGPTVVLLHEAGGALESWDAVAAALRLRCRVLRYDQRGFGMSEGAYNDQGDPDGAEFSVDAASATGAGQVVWRRNIEPKTTPAERGLQRIEVALPAETVRVVLRTTPGPQGKGDWDWTYWTQLEFSP